jgi:hypothetical protein
MEKTTTQWLAHAMMDLLGTGAVVDADGSQASALIASAQAGSIYEMHGGGTAEIQKMIMARRLGLGRRQVERSGRLR